MIKKFLCWLKAWFDSPPHSVTVSHPLNPDFSINMTGVANFNNDGVQIVKNGKLTTEGELAGWILTTP